MVTTMRDQEVFLLEPGSHSNDSHGRHQEYGFILVVEDDAPTLRLERVILEEEGYTVESVNSGEEAVEAVAAKTPTLVLLDIGLPGMDGFATCAKIRELSRVPIIMVTGRDCLDDKVMGMDVGADDYVTKPFLTHELATRVKVVLRRTAVAAQEAKDADYYESVIQDPLAPPESQPDTQASAASEQDDTEQETEEAPVQEEIPAPEPISEISAEPEAEVEEEESQESSQQPAAEVSTEVSPEEAEEEESPEPVMEEAEEGEDEDETTTEAEEEQYEELPRLPASETGIYEGTVRLTVSTLGPVRNLINFVSELRQSPQFRLLRLVANQHKEGMDIWLGLREPLELVTILSNIAGVNEVKHGESSSQDEEEQLLIVTLD